LFCELPVRIDEHGEQWRREAEFGDVVRRTVTQGCFVSPCGIRETRIVLECPTVKVVAPWKTGSSCSVLWGRQISDIVNGCVSPIASGVSHESQFDKLTSEFARSNLLKYGAEVTFKVEFVSNSSDQESVLLNQGRKVANLSDRGYEPCSDVSDVCDVMASHYKADGIWGSGASVEFSVCDAIRLKWFPLESERCPLSTKPMGSGCSMISGIDSEVLNLADEPGQASFVIVGQWTLGQWTVCSSDQLRLNSNFSEEFEPGNGVYVESQVQPNDELVSVNLQQSASQCFTSPRVANRSFAQESNQSTELVVSVSPVPSSGNSNRPTQGMSQPYACGDAQGRDNLPASGLICPKPVELPLRWIVRSVGPRPLTAQGDEGLKESRTQSEKSRNSTQTESQTTGELSLNS